MKTYYITFLFFILQSTTAIIFSQEAKNIFEIYTQENTTWFEDVQRNKFMGVPIVNKKGEKLYNPTSTFSSKEKVKKIESDLYSAAEQNYLLTHYKPRAHFLARTSDGKIVAVSFGFDNLSDPSMINIEKLQIMRNRIMSETWLENLSFNGQQAASGYISGFIRFFRP